jgi:rhamnulose-1-phosphate aldolase
VLFRSGTAGERIAGMAASEGSAGNLSLCIAWPIEVRRRFPVAEPFPLPVAVPALAGATVLVTGSGRRLREVGGDPEANVGALRIADDGHAAVLHTSPRRLFARLTSELNSHLAVHADHAAGEQPNLHAVVHAQPLQLTLLSHMPEYREDGRLTRRLLRWEPETLINLPEGLAVLPFMLPGSDELQQATLAALRTHQIVVWSKHGVMARSDHSITRVADLIEYAETAARYELLDRSTGGRAEGLTDAELTSIARAFSVPTSLY